MTFGRPGAILGDTDTAASPTGTSSRIVQPPLVNRQGLDEANPVEDELSVEAWFRTTSTQGGRILGFGNSRTGTSGAATSRPHALRVQQRPRPVRRADPA